MPGRARPSTSVATRHAVPVREPPAGEHPVGRAAFGRRQVLAGNQPEVDPVQVEGRHALERLAELLCHSRRASRLLICRVYRLPCSRISTRRSGSCSRRPRSASCARKRPVGTVKARDQQRAFERLASNQAEHIDAGVRTQDHGREALRRASAARIAEHAGVVREHLAPLVDVVDRGVAQHGVGRRVERLHRGGEKVWSDPVVVGQPFEQLAARLVEGAREVARGPKVALVAQVANPRIAGGEIACDRFRTIGRGIVADDQLEVGEALRQRRADRVLKEVLPVVDRQPDAHSRKCVHPLDPGKFVATMQVRARAQL